MDELSDTEASNAMIYSTGELMKLSDKVQLGDDGEGRVVCVLDSREFSDDYPEKDWEYLKKGAIISFPSYRLIHYEELIEEENVKLIFRADS